MVERSANVGSGEGGVTNVKDAVALGNLRNGIEVCQGEGGVGGRLAENEFGVGLDGRLDIFGVGEIDKAEGHAHRHELFAADAVGAPVAAIGNDAVITGVHKGVDAGCRGGHAGGHADGVVSVFDLGHFFLEHFDGGVVGAAVAVSLGEVLVHGFLDEGGRHVHGREDGAGFFVGDYASVDDVGVHGAVGDPAVVFRAQGPDGDGLAEPWRGGGCRAERRHAPGYFLGEHF